MRKGDLIAGLDAGSTKICVVVGEIRENGVDIIGIGEVPSAGIKKGVVVDIENAAQAISRAVEEAEAMTGVEIKAVYAGIAESRINSFLSNGVIAVKDKEIGPRDIERVMDAARAMPLPVNKEVLHVIPTGFTVDGQNGINDPRGMTGVRLEVKVQIVTAAVTSVQNLLKSCQRAGLSVIDIIFEPFASAGAVLLDGEKDVGAGVVDIGGGTTGLTLFCGGSLCHTSVLSIGGGNFTNDVAIGLRTQTPEAERIKKNYGCTLMSMINPGEEVEITYAGDKPGRTVPRQHLIEILQPRAEELFSLVKEEIRKSGYYNTLASGVVLTGGAALMNGMETIAENILELPVRVGMPKGIAEGAGIVSSPAYAAGAGLVLYGAREIMRERSLNGENFFSFSGITGKVNKARMWMRGKLGVL